MSITQPLKQLTFISLITGLILSCGVIAQSKDLIQAVNLQTMGQLAEQNNDVIVLMISSEECPYCTLIKNEILKPMLLDKNDKRQYIIRELHIDAGEKVIDFDGDTIASMNIAQKYRSTVTPTLLFLSGRGEILHKKMVGITTPELYPFYLNDAIELSIQRLHELSNR